MSGCDVYVTTREIVGTTESSTMASNPIHASSRFERAVRSVIGRSIGSLARVGVATKRRTPATLARRKAECVSASTQTARGLLQISSSEHEYADGSAEIRAYQSNAAAGHDPCASHSRRGAGVDQPRLRPPRLMSWRPASGYQTSQRSASDRTIGASALHWNASRNAGRFDSGPFTRYFAIGCGSPWTIVRCVSGRI